MIPVGAKLREQRLQLGIPLEKIAEDLRISGRYLRAIEDEQWSQLPGGFFSRSFVRQYAEALGLDPTEFEDAMISLAPPPEPVLDLVHVPKNEISVPPLPTFDSGSQHRPILLSVAALVAVVLGCAGLYAAWQKFQAQSETPATVAKSTTTQAPAAAPVQQQVPPPVVPEPQQQTQITHAVDTNPPAVSSAPNPGEVVLEIAALEKTWIDISADGKRVFAGVLEPGQVKTVPATQAARLLVGNAGGLSIRRKGQDIGPIGPRGQVRVVNFTPESYEIVQPRRPQTD